MDKKMIEFLEELASKEPVPGGGGAAALSGAIAAALGAMVANLTTGKKKYASYQEDIERILTQMNIRADRIYEFIEKDARAFAPLAAAYKLGKEVAEREEILEKATLYAAQIPLELAEELYELLPFLEELEEKGSRLAISDVAVAAVSLQAALDGAVMNVYINTGSLKDRKKAALMNERAEELTRDGGRRCRNIYERIKEDLCRS